MVLVAADTRYTAIRRGMARWSVTRAAHPPQTQTKWIRFLCYRVVGESAESRVLLHHIFYSILTASKFLCEAAGCVEEVIHKNF